MNDGPCLRYVFAPDVNFILLYHIIITIILEENFTEGRLLFVKNNYTVYNNI